MNNIYFLYINNTHCHSKRKVHYNNAQTVIHFSFVVFLEAHRALELLEDYHSRLSAPQDRTLRIAIERVIRIFKSRLFQALLGK